MSRPRSALTASAVIAALAVLISGCSADPKDVDARASAVDVLHTPDAGNVLVDGKGAVLYVFAPDDAKTVSCTFTCATNWPPFAGPETKKAVVAGKGVDQSLLGTMANPGGGTVVTYNGWPLYRYAADKKPGDHTGQDRYLNGGDWFVMSPSGKPRRS